MPTESIRIQCDVENTGEYKGDEVVQLYLKDYSCKHGKTGQGTGGI